MKHRFRKLLAGVLTVAMLASALPAALAAEGEKHITILGTSDMHGNIWGYSYEDNKESANNGMARLYTYIEQVRAENPNTILIDAGDDIQGTIMTDDLYNKTPDEPHPVITAMNFMGYDAMTLGNHEFNWGIGTMKTITGQADFPVLAANVKDADGEFVTGAGWTIVERDGVKVAVIGVVTPDVPIWDGGKEGVEACTYEAASTAVKDAIAAIGDQADVIVVSAHMGMYAEFDEENGSDSAQKILDDNPEIDVLQVAHNHTVVKDQQGSTVIGGARNGGRDIARFDLTLDADNNVISSTVEIVDMNGVTPSEEIRSIPLVAEAHQKTIDFIAGGTGEDGEKGEPLGVTTAKFQPVNEIAGLPEGKLRDTAVMDLINRIQLENAQADVSAAALFKDTSDLPEGDINYGNIFDIYKFDNTLYRVTVTGAELKGYMEWAAECYNQWVPGDINISFDPEYPGYLYDMFAGVDYEINLSKPKGERIENVMFKGEPLTDDQTLTLAVNNYRYSSALKSQGLVSGKKEWESSNSIRDMIVAYFAEHSPVEPVVDNNWAITGVDLSLSDPRRQEIIDLVNDGRLEAPYAKSYNLNDYDAIIASALPGEEPAPWYAEAQAYVEEKGLMTGTPNGFEPEGIVTRATVFQTLWNMEGKPEPIKPETDPNAGHLESLRKASALFTFTSDVEGKWYADAALWAYYNGLTVGDGTGAFAGDRSVTRAEIVTIFHRYAQFKGADLSVGEDTNILSYTDALDVAEWAIPAFQWACGAGIISGKDGGRLDPAGTATRAELATILMNCRTLAPKQVTLEEYLESTNESWFLTGKTSYTVQGMMVSKETSFHNPLEVTDYTVTDDGVSVVLKGTVGEQWVTKLEKVMKTYTKTDGTPVTAEDFAEKDVFIDLKTKAAPDSNFAMFVPKGTSVTVNTAWGDELHTNLFNAPHGDGDYLVCPNKDGQPDLSDVWVVNGAVFPTTYDMSHQPVTGTVTQVEKYGHALLDITIADFEARGFELGDVVTVTAGSYTGEMPFFDGYYVDTGDYMLRAYPGHTNIAVCINYGKFCETAGIGVGDQVTITLAEKGGAAATQATYSLKYTNDPADYADDATFANFREVTVGDIAAGKLYRSASPINNENNRAATANKLVEAAGVQAVFNLADTDEELAEYMAAEDFDSAYYAQLIQDGKVIALGMPVNYASDEFAAGIVEGLTFLSEHEGPYLVHCTEGKDRAGFTAALLEALMGASLDEIVADYMQSYVNYYHLDPVADKDKYDLIAGGNVMEMLRSVAGLEKGADLADVDLAAAAEAYLTSHGMADTALAALKANLSK